MGDFKLLAVWRMHEKKKLLQKSRPWPLVTEPSSRMKPQDDLDTHQHTASVRHRPGNDSKREDQMHHDGTSSSALRRHNPTPAQNPVCLLTSHSQILTDFTLLPLFTSASPLEHGIPHRRFLCLISCPFFFLCFFFFFSCA